MATIKPQIISLVDSINSQRANLNNEEQTKHICVMRFLYQVLGYDIFNSNEVVSEFSCDMLKEKGERVDYAILRNGSPAMIVEVKKFGENLDVHKSQLKRYYAATKSRIGILTNGLRYMFFADLVDSNLMDDRAFMDIDISNMSDAQYESLERFHKSSFDLDAILSSASVQKDFGNIKDIMRRMLDEPSAELVKLVCREMVSGRFTDNVLNKLTPMVAKAWLSIQNDLMSEKLNVVIKTNEENRIKEEGEVLEEKKREIETTEKEIEGYHYVKSIIGCDYERLMMKDNLGYCNIIMDSNQRKSIVRLYFNNENKLKLGLMKGDEMEMIDLERVEDILKYNGEIRERYNYWKSLDK